MAKGVPYHRLLFHFVWATKGRLPLVDESLRAPLYGAICAKARELGAVVLGLGGTADHVHLVVALPPSQTPATFVGQVKGSSSHLASRLGGTFAWQGEYGVVTLSESALPNVVAYVHQQQEHHAGRTTRERLEP